MQTKPFRNEWGALTFWQREERFLQLLMAHGFFQEFIAFPISSQKQFNQGLQNNLIPPLSKGPISSDENQLSSSPPCRKFLIITLSNPQYRYLLLNYLPKFCTFMAVANSRPLR